MVPLQPHLPSIRHPERSGEILLRGEARLMQPPRSRTFLRRGRRNKAKYDDLKTLQIVKEKAKREHRTEKELEQKIKSARSMK